jgi:type I restriction enzyme S subunit
LNSIRVGEVCDLVNGKAFKPADWSTSGTPIIRIQNLNGADRPFNYWAGPLDRQVNVEKGDVLLAWSGTPGTSFGVHIWNRMPGILNQHIFRVDLDESKITPRWFMYAVNGQLNRLIAQAHGGVGLQHLTRRMVDDLEIPLPRLDEQRRIAAILDKADALRRKRKRALELLDSLPHSIFLEMFGEQAKIASVSLAEICRKITDGTHQSPKWGTQGVPFLFVSNIRRQQISFNTKNFVSEEEYRKLIKHNPIEPGDVLYTAVGSYGNTAVVPRERRFIFQRHIAHLKPKPDRVNSHYLSIALETPDAKRQADRKATGIAQKTVTLASLKEMTLPLPPIELQNEFAAKVNFIWKQWIWVEKSIGESEALFSSLQHRAFSGQL